MPIKTSRTTNSTYVQKDTVQNIPWRNSLIYLIMNPNQDYHDYSALDAPNPLFNVLERFFSQKKNTYKYALANKHFDAIKQSNTFADATRLFKVITGTDLVTNKHVLQYRTSQGMRYMVKKTYEQSNQRDQRTARRRNLKDPPQKPDEHFVSNTPSPFLALMKTSTPFDDSSDSSSESKIDNEENNPEPTPTNNLDGNAVTDRTDDHSSIHSDVTKHAEALEKDMESAMADLKDSDEIQEDSYTNPKLTSFIQEVFDDKITTLLQRLETTEIKLSRATNQINDLQQSFDKFSTKIQLITSTQDRLNRQLNFVSRQVDTYDEKFANLTTFKSNDLNGIYDRLEAQIHTRLNQAQVNTNQFSTQNDARLQNITAKQDKMQRRFLRLKDNTKTMFQQTESDYDLLTDRIHRLENDFKSFEQNSNLRSSRKQLNFKQSSDSDDTSSSISLLSIKREQTRTPLSHRSQKANYYRGPNMDYLRKNVNITCTTQDQILEFYIKLRLAIGKGGIHISPIQDITKDKSIAHQLDCITSADIQTQSNTLFTLMSNENFIPNNFTMAQNCILGYAATMDGFGALKAMLKLTHPILSRKRPPNNPPSLSSSNDIHSYEQSLRNYYLLHKLYNDTDYPSIEKSKQFLHGMDDDRYADAVARVQHQLDTVETLNVELHEDYNIDNIASTIINISGEYDNNRTVVNTMQQNNFTYPHLSKDKQQMTRFHDTKSFQSKRQPQRRFMKVQCHACKQFGHGLPQCTLLPKVLAILQFHRRNNDKCTQILKQHITNNTINSKRTFVRTLMNMDIIPHDDDSDAYLHNDIIVNAIMDNDVDDNDINSQSE